MQMKVKDLYFNLVQKQKFLQSVSASDKKSKEINSKYKLLQIYQKGHSNIT